MVIKLLKNSPIPTNVTSLQLYIKRDNSGFSKRLYPKYGLYLSSNNRFLMMAQRMQIMRSAYYVISTNTKVTNRKSHDCIGQLRSNFSQTEFNIFGPGENCKRKFPLESTRCQYGTINYILDPNNINGQIKMDVIIPKVTNPDEFNEYKPMHVMSLIILEIRISWKKV